VRYSNQGGEPVYLDSTRLEGSPLTKMCRLGDSGLKSRNGFRLGWVGTREIAPVKRQFGL
jgi:hypothetical protein